MNIYDIYELVIDFGTLKECDENHSLFTRVEGYTDFIKMFVKKENNSDKSNEQDNVIIFEIMNELFDDRKVKAMIKIIEKKKDL